MRISDWSSDVCSSDLSSAAGLRCGFAAGDAPLIDGLDLALRVGGAGVSLPILAAGTRLWRDEAHVTANRDRKSVVSGKSVSVRVDLGGRRNIKKQKQQQYIQSSSSKYHTSYYFANYVVYIQSKSI